MPPVVCDVTDIVLQSSIKHGYQGGTTQHRQIGASLRVVIPVATMNRDAVPSNLVLEFLEGGSVYEATHRLGKSFLG